jgi:hypothetical protein
MRLTSARRPNSSTSISPIRRRTSLLPVVPEYRRDSGIYVPAGALDGPYVPPYRQMEMSDGSSLLARKDDDESVEMIFCAPTPEELGLSTPSLAEAIALVERLPFEPTMRAMSVIAAELQHHPRDRARHLRLGAEVYVGQVGERFKAFVEESPSHVGFDARHVAALQRLVVQCARPGISTAPGLTAAERGWLAGALLAMSSVLPISDLPEGDPQSDSDWAEWARYLMLVSSWHHEPDLLEAIAGSHALYFDAAAALEGKDAASCEIAAWMVEDYGLNLGEQFAGGLACAIVSRALDRHAEPRQRLIHLEPGLLSKGRLAGKEPALFDLISATRQDLSEMMAAVGDDPARIAWDHTAFEQRPFLRAPDGTLTLISSRGLLSWLTRGMHHRALQAAERRPHPRNPRKNSALIYLTYAGRLGEYAVGRLMAMSHEVQSRAAVVRLHQEHSYMVGKQRKDSPDLVLDYGEELIVLEVFSGRISREARTSLDPEEMDKALEKATTSKLLELSARMRELLAGELTYDGLELGRIKRVWPVLLQAGDPIFQSPALWQYLRGTADGAFLADARVQKPTLLNIGDLEPLLALVQEEGKLLPELLAEISTSAYAELPARNWVHATRGGIPKRPGYVDEQYNAAMDLAKATLFSAEGPGPQG